MVLHSFSDRPSTPQTSAAPATPHPNTLNANMQSPRQNNAPTTKEPTPTNRGNFRTEKKSYLCTESVCLMK